MVFFNSCNIRNEVYRGGRAGGGGVGIRGGWEAEGGQHHPQGGKQQCYVLSSAQKLPQSTWQDETVVSSSLTPQADLLVPISGPIDPVVDRHGFTGSAKDRL